MNMKSPILIVVIAHLLCVSYAMYMYPPLFTTRLTIMLIFSTSLFMFGMGYLFGRNSIAEAFNKKDKT